MRGVPRSPNRYLKHLGVMGDFNLRRSKVKLDGFYNIPPSLFLGIACRSATRKFRTDCRETTRNGIKLQHNAELHGFSIGLLPSTQLR